MRLQSTFTERFLDNLKMLAAVFVLLLATVFVGVPLAIATHLDAHPVFIGLSILWCPVWLAALIAVMSR